ncbi:MAG: DNA polymerase III subunit alpha [Gammaproteobacteria bacterium]|nr:DNA polymerase III subunit alpha [Gammaproteobacteria bacterium]
MSARFVHLHLHTEYSLVDGVLRIKPLVQAVADLGMPAVAVTEQGNLFSAIKFYRAAVAAGVKPIIGADLAFYNAADENQPSRLVLLCQNLEGYRNLSRLVTRSYVDGRVRGGTMLMPEWLDDAGDGLIALSGGRAGDIGQAILSGRYDEAPRRLEAWRSRFPDRFYLELQRTGRDDEDAYLGPALDLASAHDVPVVATNDVRFLTADDFQAHEARVCIHQGRTLADPRRPRHYSEQQYLRSPEEMQGLFADLPEALENSVEIARRCNLELEFDQSYLPDFPVPEGTTLDDWLRQESKRGLDQRLARMGGKEPPASADVYRARLDSELDVIIGMGFPGSFLIVADFFRWARENGVPVGPGRGSGAGSLAAYALGITDLDPIEHDLLFERFLNPERVSMPDFDIDFCMEGRDRVIDYVARKYGNGDVGGARVSQIITFGTMAAKAVVRDVGRVLGHPYGFVDQLAKLIPFEIGMTLEKALANEERLRQRYREEEEVRSLIDLAMKLEGLARNAGKHAGGVVIAPTALTDFTPLYREQGSSSLVTQFDKDDVESVGLVKFDFLGLRTLTIIDRAVRSINAGRAERGEAALDIGDIPIDDGPTYELIRSARTTAVFQLESHAMKDLIRRLQPENFEDLIALNALIRPGPSELADDFIACKHGRQVVEYRHPRLKEVLDTTYGIILYQEQVMQIAQVLSGYTLGEADLLRRAMGKKKPEEMAQQRAVFVGGARAQGVDQRTATEIFDIIERFAGYGFNKSHSAAYALIAFQTAWLKKHYPADFMAAVLSSDMDHTDKVVVFLDDCGDMGLESQPPDVNTSAYAFTVADPRTIRYGLGAVKGVGSSAIAAIVDERERNGPYEDLFDFCQRVDAKKVNRRVIEALIRCGALDGLGPSRASMMASLTHALRLAEQHARNASSGQDDMFGVTVRGDDMEHVFAEIPEWPDEERLFGEKETLGLYLSGHPVKRFQSELASLASRTIADLQGETADSCTVAGLLVRMRTINTRNGRMAILTLDDDTARMEAVVYADLYQKHRDVLVADKVLVLEGALSRDDYTGEPSLRVSQIYDLEEAREARARRLLVQLKRGKAENGFVQALAETLTPFRDGRTPVCVEYCRTDAKVRLPLGDGWRVSPTEELLSRLKQLAGTDCVAVEY